MGNDLLQVIQEEGVRQYPNEACGVVVRVGKKSVAIPCKNAADNPQTHFVMDVADYCAAADQGEIVGIWHTHPEASSQPSDADRVGCENSEVPWYIVGISKAADSFYFDEMAVVEPSGFEMPYLERPYAFGVLDCWSLVRDYYRREFGIQLGNYPRIERFWAKGHNFFGSPENWEKEGLVLLTNDEEPRNGDLFFIQTDRFDAPNHVGIYVGNEMMLHHAHGRLSRHDIYGGYWQKHTTHHLRHRSRM